MISHCLKKGTQPCRVADDGFSVHDFLARFTSWIFCQDLPVWASQALSRPLWHSTLLTKPLACWRISPANYLSSPCFGNGCNKNLKHAALALWLVRGRRAEFELFGQCFHLLAGNMFFAAASWGRQDHVQRRQFENLAPKMHQALVLQDPVHDGAVSRWDPRIHASAKMEQWHWHASTIHKPLLWRHGLQNVLNRGLLFSNGPNQRLTNPFYEDMDHKM